MAYKKIIVGIDDGDNVKKVIKKAIELAQFTKAKLALVHVLDPSLTSVSIESGVLTDSMVNMLKDRGEALMNECQKAYPDVEITKFLNWGLPGEEILTVAESWGADLIVTGTHEKSGLERLFVGSIAAHIIKHAKVPVLVVPIK